MLKQENSVAADTAPLFYEDLVRAHCWRSQEREVTRELVMQFAELTGDHDPLHVDDEFASETPFRQPVAHGLLGLSLLAGLSSNCPRVKTVAFTGIESWQFKRPIFFGDVVHAETEVVQLEPYGRRAGKVTWFRQLVNQDGHVVQQGDLQTIVAARSVMKP